MGAGEIEYWGRLCALCVNRSRQKVVLLLFMFDGFFLLIGSCWTHYLATCATIGTAATALIAGSLVAALMKLNEAWEP